MARKASKAPAVVLSTEDDIRGLLVKLIDGSGISRYEILKRSGVPESRQSRCYTGTTATTFETLRPVADALGCRVVVRVEPIR